VTRLQLLTSSLDLMGFIHEANDHPLRRLWLSGRAASSFNREIGGLIPGSRLVHVDVSLGHLTLIFPHRI